MSINWDIEIFDTIPSTQDILKTYADDGAPEGKVAQAIQQSDGRGRHGREWVSEPGNLYMSMLLRPQGGLKTIGQVAIVAAVALAETIKPLLNNPGDMILKWPNDVLVDDKKCAGILVETGNSAELYAIAGLGVNITSAPSIGTALNDHTKEPIDIEKFRDKFLRRFTDLYMLWQMVGFEAVRASWLELAHEKGTELVVKVGTVEQWGAFEDIDSEGNLILLEPSGLRKKGDGGRGLPYKVDFMMLLAIDIGNTNTVFAVYDGEALKAHWRCETVAGRSADEYASFLKELFELAKMDWKSLDDVIIASVVPAADFNIGAFCKKYLEKTPMMVGLDQVPVKVDLPNPEEVGADRLVNALAIKEFYKTPAIVIDFGTATTFDVIDADGHYLGGAIAPGINLSVEALHRAAAKLPKVDVKKPPTVIGKSTVSAIQSGIFYGYLGLIEGIIERITQEMGAKPFVLATGGLARLFQPHTKAIHDIDDELTLKGLLKIYQHVKKKK